ncbi:MAG: GNAT family N-acetyltransferase [Clostridiales bacterium]|nr:GNAT family N-acetyltransferase [Clostridiales bacterium]
MNKTEIKIIPSTSAEFEYIKSIRTQVFINELHADGTKEFDEYDLPSANTKHFILFDEGTPVATARLAFTPSGAKLGRIAVLKQYRSKGFGASLVKAVLTYAFAENTVDFAEYVLVDARAEAVPFYKQFGFAPIGKVFTDRGLPHIPMCIDKGVFVNE